MAELETRVAQVSVGRGIVRAALDGRFGEVLRLLKLVVVEKDQRLEVARQVVVRHDAQSDVRAGVRVQIKSRNPTTRVPFGPRRVRARSTVRVSRASSSRLPGSGQCPCPHACAGRRRQGDSSLKVERAVALGGRGRDGGRGTARRGLVALASVATGDRRESREADDANSNVLHRSNHLPRTRCRTHPGVFIRSRRSTRRHHWMMPCPCVAPCQGRAR